MAVWGPQAVCSDRLCVGGGLPPTAVMAVLPALSRRETSGPQPSVTTCSASGFLPFQVLPVPLRGLEIRLMLVSLNTLQ